MTTEEIHASLEKMLADPKAKKFLNHLIRSYMPITKVTKVETKPTGLFKCALTRTELVSISDVMTGLETEEFKTNFFKDVRTMAEGKTEGESPMAKLIGDKKLGVTGKDTNTFMSYPAFQIFYNWVTVKALHGDKHINWLLSSMRENNKGERIERPIHKAHDKPQERATYSLGDFDVLQKLKEEFKNKE